MMIVYLCAVNYDLESVQESAITCSKPRLQEKAGLLGYRGADNLEVIGEQPYKL